MEKLLLIFTILLNQNVYSSSCQNNGELAYHACEETGLYKSLCQKAVGTNHADEAAVRVCLMMNHVPDNIMYDCIRKTVNKVFSDREINTCAKKPSFKKGSCIMNSGKIFIPSIVSLNSGDVAYRACEETGMFEKICKSAVGTNHADEAAVNVCLSAIHAPDNLKYDCIRKTVNKTFSQREILKCANKPGFTKVSCIMNTGKPVINNYCY